MCCGKSQGWGVWLQEQGACVHCGSIMHKAGAGCLVQQWGTSGKDKGNHVHASAPYVTTFLLQGTVDMQNDSCIRQLHALWAPQNRSPFTRQLYVTAAGLPDSLFLPPPSYLPCVRYVRHVCNSGCFGARGGARGRGGRSDTPDPGAARAGAGGQAWARGMVGMIRNRPRGSTCHHAQLAP